MEVEVDSIYSAVKSLYQDQCDDLLGKEERNIIVSHFGGFSLDLISSLSESIENLLVSKGDNATVRKRMFSILIEGMQNVRKHGAEDEHKKQIGYVIVASVEEDYKIIIANLVNSSDKSKLQEYISKINNYSEDELVVKYSSVLTNEFLTQTGGAGLGLITTRLKTGNRLGYNCYSVSDELDLFAFEVILPRKISK